MKAAPALAVLCIAVGFWPASGQAQTLERIKARGKIICGASQGVPGFSLPDANGVWKGFDTDMCRALAAAILNDPMKAEFMSLSAKDRFAPLQSGEVDVLTRTTTWTIARDSLFGLNFTAVNYYDGQGFMVPRKLGIEKPEQLAGGSVCATQGTSNEMNLADFFRSKELKFEPVVFATNDEVVGAYEAGRCDAISLDVSSLAAIRLKFRAPDEHVILPQLISKEPLGSFVRAGDDQWFRIVRWTQFALLNAEELGVTKANVDKMVDSKVPDIRRLLGSEGNAGEGIGLSKDWVVRIIRAVGNYGESFERNLGSESPLKLARGANNLWTKGGLQYAPPIR